MSYGKIIFGKVEFEIQGIYLRSGLINFSCKATPRLKHLLALPDRGRVPYAIYGADGLLIAVGAQPAEIFNEAKECGLALADIYMVVPIKFITEMT